MARDKRNPAEGDGGASKKSSDRTGRGKRTSRIDPESTKVRQPFKAVNSRVRAVLQAAARADLNGSQWRALSAVIAYTATWSKHADYLSRAQILEEFYGVEATPHRLKDLSRRLRELAELGLVEYVPGYTKNGRRVASIVGLPALDQGGQSTPLNRGVKQRQPGGSNSANQGGQPTPPPKGDSVGGSQAAYGAAAKPPRLVRYVKDRGAFGDDWAKAKARAAEIVAGYLPDSTYPYLDVAEHELATVWFEHDVEWSELPAGTLERWAIVEADVRLRGEDAPGADTVPALMDRGFGLSDAIRIAYTQRTPEPINDRMCEPGKGLELDAEFIVCPCGRCLAEKEGVA